MHTTRAKEIRLNANAEFFDEFEISELKLKILIMNNFSPPTQPSSPPIKPPSFPPTQVGSPSMN